MKFHKHCAANAQLHRTWEPRPQFSFTSHSLFHLSLDKLGLIIISAERGSIEIKSEFINCFAIKAVLVKDLGRRGSNDKNEEQGFLLLLFPLFLSPCFHKELHITFYFLLSLLSKLSFQKLRFFCATFRLGKCDTLQRAELVIKQGQREVTLPISGLWGLKVRSWLSRAMSSLPRAGHLGSLLCRAP